MCRRHTGRVRNERDARGKLAQVFSQGPGTAGMPRPCCRPRLERDLPAIAFPTSVVHLTGYLECWRERGSREKRQI
jgi:hypothetical protein